MLHENLDILQLELKFFLFKQKRYRNVGLYALFDMLLLTIQSLSVLRYDDLQDKLEALSII